MFCTYVFVIRSVSVIHLRTIEVITSCDRLYKNDSRADGTPIFTIFLTSSDGKGFNSLNIDGFSIFLNNTINSTTVPTKRLKLVAIATPRTPSRGIPKSPSTKTISRTVFTMFIPTVTYIEICVIPWLRIITEVALSTA